VFCFPSFTPDELLSDKLQAKGYKAKVLEHGVEVSDPSMSCFVPFNNVAYVQFMEGSDEPVKSSKSK
jgi:hypothetical protein